MKDDSKELTESSQEDENNINNYLTDSYLHKGLVLANQKSYDCAIESLKEANKEAKKYGNDYAYIYREIADIYRQQGKYEESWKELAKSVKKYEKEIETKEKEYHLNPTKFDPSYIVDYWYNRLGNIYHHFLHKYDKAEQIYLKGLELDSNNKNALVSLTNLYLKIMQDRPKAKDKIKKNQHCAYYYNANKYYHKALKILEKNKNRLGDSLSLIELGNFLLTTKKIATKEQYREIENYFLEAIKIEKDPKNKNKEPKNAVDAYSGLGVFYLDQNSLHQAIDYFKKAHKLEPGDFNIWSSLAETYLKQNKLEQADKEFRDLLAINPYHLDSNIGLGQVYLAMGDAGETEMYYKAIDCFNETKEILDFDRGSRKLKSSELADISYLQGYANFQIYQKSELLQRRDKFLKDALSNFKNSSHYCYEAKRAKEKIESNYKIYFGSTSREEWTSRPLALLPFILFIGIQGLYFLPESISLKFLPQLTDLKFGSTGYITLTVVFVILIAILWYFPEITKLSVGQKGIELEKSSSPQIKQISIDNVEINNLIISRPPARKRRRDQKLQLERLEAKPRFERLGAQLRFDRITTKSRFVGLATQSRFDKLATGLHSAAKLQFKRLATQSRLAGLAMKSRFERIVRKFYNRVQHLI